jgi:hypothetical protein
LGLGLGDGAAAQEEVVAQPDEVRPGLVDVLVPAAAGHHVGDGLGGEHAVAGAVADGQGGVVIGLGGGAEAAQVLGAGELLVGLSLLGQGGVEVAAGLALLLVAVAGLGPLQTGPGRLGGAAGLGDLFGQRAVFGPLPGGAGGGQAALRLVPAGDEVRRLEGQDGLAIRPASPPPDGLPIRPTRNLTTNSVRVLP